MKKCKECGVELEEIQAIAINGIGSISGWLCSDCWYMRISNAIEPHTVSDLIDDAVKRLNEYLGADVKPFQLRVYSWVENFPTSAGPFVGQGVPCEMKMTAVARRPVAVIYCNNQFVKITNSFTHEVSWGTRKAGTED